MGHGFASVPAGGGTGSRTKKLPACLVVPARRPAVLPVPSPALRLALGEMSQLLLTSQRVRENASEAGFCFRFANLADALADVC